MKRNKFCAELIEKGKNCMQENKTITNKKMKVQKQFVLKKEGKNIAF